MAKRSISEALSDLRDAEQRERDREAFRRLPFRAQFYAEERRLHERIAELEGKNDD